MEKLIISFCFLARKGYTMKYVKTEYLIPLNLFFHFSKGTQQDKRNTID